MGADMDNRSTELRFQGRYSAADLEALARFSVSQILDARIGRATVSATILLAIAAVLLQSWAVAILGLAGVLGVSALVRYVLLPGRLLRHARSMPGTAGSRTILIGAAGIRHQAEGHEQSFPLGAVRRMVLHKQHLFILLRPSGCLMLPLDWIQLPVTIEDVVRLLAGRGHA
jgi:hypothetical protein